MEKLESTDTSSEYQRLFQTVRDFYMYKFTTLRNEIAAKNKKLKNVRLPANKKIEEKKSSDTEMSKKSLRTIIDSTKLNIKGQKHVLQQFTGDVNHILKKLGVQKQELNEIERQTKEKQYNHMKEDLQEGKDTQDTFKNTKRANLDPTRFKGVGVNQDWKEKFDKWKVDKGLDPTTKVFCIYGGKYDGIRKGLLKRGWYENVDETNLSDFWDLKYTAKFKEINLEKVVAGQILPHVVGTVSICSKLMLMKNIRNLSLEMGESSPEEKIINPNEFFPRCFELREETDLKNFQTEYKINRFQIHLLKMLAQVQKNVTNRFRTENNPQINPFINLKDLAKFSLSLLVMKKVNTFYTRLDNTITDLVTHEEWMHFLNIDCMSEKDVVSFVYDFVINIEEGLYDIYNSELVLFLKERWNTISIALNENKEDFDKQQNNVEMCFSQCSWTNNIIEQRQTYHCQHVIDGMEGVWILKPTGSSRGRGITCMNNLSEILHYMISSDMEFVAQKYIERPLLIKKRKFDVRQWALVNSFDPLEVWIFDEFYVRFAADDYNYDNLQDIYTHLTNNSVTKDFEQKGLTNVFELNMMSQENFKKEMEIKKQEKMDQIRKQRGPCHPVENDETDYFAKIKKRIEELVILTQQAGKQFVSSRKGSFCVFGYDFMVDEDFNVWLIEINTSPDMTHSTPVTTRLVPEFQESIIKWVVDYNVFGKRNEEADIGKLKRIYKEKKLSAKERLEARFAKKTK